MTLRLVPYVRLNGNTKEALGFYEKALDAKVSSVMTFGEMPANPNSPLPEAAKNLVAHALLKVGEAELMFSDAFPGMPFQAGSQVGVCIVSYDADHSRKVFDALAQGGRVGMPLQQTFWSPAYGIVTDKYGVEWQISTETTH